LECYFDNAATTQVFDGAISVMEKVMREDYGNPSSRHQKGYVAEQYVTSAKKTIAKALKCKDSEIILTSGGTESNNLALIGIAEANKRAGKHIISTGIEHASVYNPLIFLEEQGYEVTFLGTDAYGRVRVEELKAAIRPDTILVSIMMINNEVGAVEPIEELAKIVHGTNPKTIFFVDAIQGFMKLPIFPGRIGVDALSVSGHKIHGPKGSGFLYLRDKVKIRPEILGGGQQKGMRSGTENVPAIAGLSAAIEEYSKNFSANTEHLYQLKQAFIEGLLSMEEVVVHALPLEECEGDLSKAVRKTAPHVVSVGFTGIKAEVFLHALEERGIYVSSGSACSSNHPAISGTLESIQVRKDLLDSTLRFSFCEQNTLEQVEYALEQIREMLPIYRKIRKY